MIRDTNEPPAGRPAREAAGEKASEGPTESRAEVVLWRERLQEPFRRSQFEATVTEYGYRGERLHDVLPHWLGRPQLVVVCGRLAAALAAERERTEREREGWNADLTKVAMDLETAEERAAELQSDLDTERERREAVERERDEATELLRRAEWICDKEAGPERDWCPLCERLRHYGHESDCSLSAYLAAHPATTSAATTATAGEGTSEGENARDDEREG